MAGIYIHIPFCKQACSYCNFHFSTLLKNKFGLLDAIESEIKNKQDFFDKETIIETIYFGGGTPSLLEKDELHKIIAVIKQCFAVAPDAEITLEANPDDLDTGKLEDIRNCGVNRLSIGIQSFDDDILQWMNRSHNAGQAEEVVKNAQHTGFDNISIDLIYGFPKLSHRLWEKTMGKAVELNVQHISAYQLTIEKNTLLGNTFSKDKFLPADDDFVAEQFEQLIGFMEIKGFRQYEISNFSKAGFVSKHNSSYWLGEPYLGIGPSAHSYKKPYRSWNIANNAQYIKRIKNKTSYSEKELIDETTACNEYILTHLRTQWGVALSYFDTERKRLLIQEAQPYLVSECLQIENETLYLTRKGKMLADRISSDLFF